MLFLATQPLQPYLQPYCCPPGIADAYWEYRLKPWDMAAGVLIVEEAGGSVTTMDGRAFSGARCAVCCLNLLPAWLLAAAAAPKVCALIAWYIQHHCTCCCKCVSKPR